MNYYIIPGLKSLVPLGVNEILQVAARYFGCTKQDLLQKYGKRENTTRKLICLLVIRQKTKLSHSEIAEIFQYCDHSSVVNNVTSAKSKIFKNIDLRRDYNAILNCLN